MTGSPLRRALLLLAVGLVGAAVFYACGARLLGGITTEHPPKPRPPGYVQPAGDALHGPLTALLATHVDARGDVDYEGLMAQRAALDAYLDALNFADPAAMSPTERLAYWINAYNAYTLRLILDHYPLASIRDIPERARWLARIHACGGRYLSLDEIEHAILRVEFEEPRIHFAINCASRSCPALRAEAYLPSRLESQLAAATAGMLADPERGLRIDTPGRRLALSRLFHPLWFRADFVRRHPSALAFVLAHCAATTRAEIEALGPDPAIDYLGYDWSLNRATGPR